MIPEQPNFVWICPQCERKVPNRLEECRCGYQRGAGELSIADPGRIPEVVTVDPPARSNVLHWIALVSVAAIVIGVLVAIQKAPARRADTTPTAPQSTAIQPPEHATPQASPAETTPGPSTIPDAWPTPVAEPAAPALAPTGAASYALEDVVSSSLPAIVSIETREGRGSGFFVAPKTVVTNRHVVGTNTSVNVRLGSGDVVPGRVDTVSQDFDLALVRVDSAPSSQIVLPMSSVSAVRPGQEVIAIGLALGVFQNTVTRGIVSAVRRAGSTVVIQTDAAINPGNSGGPLLNRSGQVIGINSMKIAGNAESLAFAIAIDHARALLGTGGGPPAAAFNGLPPASTNEPLTRAFTGRTEGDEKREAGARAYEQLVRAAAQRAASLDGYWTRIKANCAIRVASGYDREWFGLWDGRAELVAADASCGSAMREMQDMSGEIKTAMASGQEDARHADVLPGQLREIRRHYRMDWTGFN